MSYLEDGIKGRRFSLCSIDSMDLRGQSNIALAGGPSASRPAAEEQR